MKKIFLTSTLLLSPFSAGAVGLVDYNNQSLRSIIDKATTYLLGFAAALALLFIIYGGLQMITASGNKDRYAAAKKTLTFAIFGLIIVVLSLAIIKLVVSLPSAVGITS